MEMPQPMVADEQSAAQPRKVSGRPFPPGVSGNPSGMRVSKHALQLFTEIADEYGGEQALSAIDRALLLQAARLLVRAQRLKDADAAIRMTGEARRLLESLRRNAGKAAAKAKAMLAPSFSEIAEREQAAAAEWRDAELADDEAAAEAPAVAAGAVETSTATGTGEEPAGDLLPGNAGDGRAWHAAGSALQGRCAGEPRGSDAAGRCTVSDALARLTGHPGVDRGDDDGDDDEGRT